MTPTIDIFEDRIPLPLLKILLQDHTTHNNIYWATDNYGSLGPGYAFADAILPELITGEHGRVIRPRVLKEKEIQRRRVKEKAEVFTPRRVCNLQNNLVEAAWFGREEVFNRTQTTPQGEHLIIPTEPGITFPPGKVWTDYLQRTELEITCGEAPYLVSRYDAATGLFIPIPERIGLLDRKLRVVNENAQTPDEWHRAALTAYRHVYGYEWQGDSLLLARENLLYTYIDYYTQRWQSEPPAAELRRIAEVISWNLWQMDGFKMVLPMSCTNKTVTQYDLFGQASTTVEECPGCKQKNRLRLNGIYARIKDWSTGKSVPFVSLLKS